MIGQTLEHKRKRGDESPFHAFENKTYNQDTHSYTLDMGHIWVWNIYKKDLQKLGANIIKSELGGRIGHFATSDWCFLITKDDYERIMEEWMKAIKEAEA
jgi:hypothetical protein